MEASQNFLADEKIGKLMQKYSIPCIISLLVGALYNIVDQIFIANASYLGSYGNAANTVVYPLTVIALAIAVCIGDGACAFFSNLMGSGKTEQAKKVFGNAILLSAVMGVIICAVYLIFKGQLVNAFGGTVNEKTNEYSNEYLFWIATGIPFYMFGQAMNPVIRADGSPRFAMVSTVAGAVANIILDPIFIFGFKWGMMGAAVATVIGQVITAVLAIWYLFHLKSIKIDKKSFLLDGKIVGRTLSLGLCSFLSQISLVCAMLVINNMITKYSVTDEVFSNPELTQIPMAVVGIVMKFFQIVISIVVGMSAGCIPIVGFNMGAGLKHRVKECFTKLLIGEAIVGFIALIIVEIFPGAIINIFGASGEVPEYTEFALKAFRIYLCMVVLACINKAAFIFLQAMGKALASTALSMIREIVFGCGFALLLPLFFGLDGVLYSMPVSDVLTAVVSLIIIITTYKQLSDKKEIKE